MGINICQNPSHSTFKIDPNDNIGTNWGVCLIWFYAPGLMGEGLGKTKKEKDKKTE